MSNRGLHTPNTNRGTDNVMAKRTLKANNAVSIGTGSGDNPARILMQCSTAVARDAVTRRTVNGVEEIVISSMTLPDDIVMNGGLYPGEEIAKSFHSLERTLAPVEHPTDNSGNFISAADPEAIHNFYAGAFNENVRQENGRIAIDKVINVAEALKSERGKRLLDRITEIETNEKARPIHTSVGVFLDVEQLDAPQSNAQGHEFTWIAHNMFFDHDAILLDSVGAAQPGQGVGMAVNSAGEEIQVQQSLVTIDADSAEEMSHNEIREALQVVISQPPLSGDWVNDVFDGQVIYSSGDLLFSAPYIMDGQTAKITGIPLPVDRDVSYIPKTNSKGDAMKELMLSALAAAGITVNADMTDDELMAKYNELQANQHTAAAEAAAAALADDGATADEATAIANAVKPLADELAAVKLKLNEKDDEELDGLAEIIGNSDKFPGLDAAAAKATGIEACKAMAANCATSHGLPLHTNDGSTGASHAYAMPE